MWSPISTLNSLARALPSRRLVQPSSVDIFFRFPKVGGTPKSSEKLGDFSLETTIVTWGAPFSDRPKWKCFSFSSGLWNVDSRNEPGNLQVEKLKSWHQESRTSFRYSTYNNCLVSLWILPSTGSNYWKKSALTLATRLVGPRRWGRCFFFGGPSAAFLAGGGWDQW